MKKHRQPKFWRLARVYFRGFRLAVWLIVLVLVAALVYLNQVGLPDFVKKPILERLRARGIDLQFSRLRMRWIEGIVAESVVFGKANDPLGAELTADTVQVELNSRALARLRLQVDSLVLERGRLRLPPGDAADPGRELALENIHTVLRLLPGDQWALDNFTADMRGAKIRLSGNVTNASHLKRWQVVRTERPKGARTWEDRLLRGRDILDRIRFPTPPEIRLNVNGDAQDLTTFQVRLAVSAPGAETPWGSVTNGSFSALLLPVDTHGTIRAELALKADGARTPWASVNDLDTSIQMKRAASDTNFVAGNIRLSAGVAETKWARSARTLMTAQWVHSVTNPIPLSGECHFEAAGAVTRWAEARALTLDGDFVNRGAIAGYAPADASWGWWTNIHPYQFRWSASAGDAVCRGVQAGEVDISGMWQAPELVVSNLHARLGPGSVRAGARLAVDSRKLEANATSTADPQRLYPLLTAGARKWLAQFAWMAPPEAEVSGSVVLPSWTNHKPDWRAEVQPTLNLAGRFEAASGGSYRGVSVSRAQSSFTYSNLNWHLPDLVVEAGRGQLRADYRVNDSTKLFHWTIDSTIDPGIVRPLLGEAETKGFNLAEFRELLLIEGEVWGRLHQPELTGARALVSVTNFSFRGQSFDTLGAVVEYTNKVLQCLSPRVTRDGRQASADSVIANFETRLVYLTNAFANMDPLVIARSIGPKVGKAVEAYEFRRPPNARVNGVAPMKGEEGADLRFEVEGEDFHWWKFNLARLAGTVHWRGRMVTLRDVQADFYEGKASGFGNFFIESQPGSGTGEETVTRFEFGAAVTNALLQFLVADVLQGTNRLEGRLNGTLSVTSGDTRDWRTVHGYGSAELRDGLIWDIPLFGVFSPVLNAISPGLGNSRATAAACTFMITNGVVRTSDMDMRCGGMRLRYDGAADLEGRVDTRVEAELLRDMWVVGPLVSTVFWPVSKMFEYRVTGTLSDPKAEPVYVFPKLVLLPFQPFRTLRGLFPDGGGSGRTNAPPPGS